MNVYAKDYYLSPLPEQMKALDAFIELMPEKDVNWLSSNGNLEYYIECRGRAEMLMEKLSKDIVKGA